MIKLAIPDIGEEELCEIRKVFDSKYLIQGDKVEEFENKVKEYLNVKHVIAVSSGTAALHLALLAIEIGVGDEVLVPDFTFPATANVVEIVGGTTKLVDITLDSLCIDIEQIEEKITSKTKVIIPVHEFGQSADMDQIIELAKKYNLSIIEDAACALGAEYKSKKVGTIGDIGCFSLHPRKAITTGEGGLVVTNNDDYAERIKILRNHGLNNVNGRNQFIMAGLNYRMTDIQGAIGVIQMKKLNFINEKRKEVARKYDELFINIKNIRLPEEKSYCNHVWQTYHILLDEKIDRDKLILMLKEKQIETNFGAYAVHNQPYYKQKYRYEDRHFLNSTIAYRQGLAVPLHHMLTDSQVEQIAYNLRKCILV